jgi:Na+/H+ antiporter NhaD/arsenite permease-like protein
MTIQSTTTITSNSYFAWLFPVYLLNIIPAIVADTLIFRYSEKKKALSLSSKIDNTIDNRAKKWYLISSIVVSMFYITLFFPWTIDVFGGYFEPPNTLRTEKFSFSF